MSMKGLPECDKFRRGYEFAQQENASLAGTAAEPVFPTDTWSHPDFIRGYEAFYSEVARSA